MYLVKVNAMWCPSCLIMNNHYEKIANKYNLELKSLDYDLDENEVKELHVGNILPVLIIYKNNEEILRIVGEQSYQQLEKKIGELL